MQTVRVSGSSYITLDEERRFSHYRVPRKTIIVEISFIIVNNTRHFFERIGDNRFFPKITAARKPYWRNGRTNCGNVISRLIFSREKHATETLQRRFRRVIAFCRRNSERADDWNIFTVQNAGYHNNGRIIRCTKPAEPRTEYAKWK